MIVVDTNVLMYATGRDHPLLEPCRRFVDAVGDGAIHATTTTAVIEEFLHARARAGREDAVRLAREYFELLEPLLVIESSDLDAGFRIFERNERLDAFDAVLAATAIRHDASVLSADRAFADIGRVTHIAPGTPAFEELLTV